MAYGDESAVVGINYVRAAAVNLALVDAPFIAVPQPAAAPSFDGPPLKLFGVEISAHQNASSLGFGTAAATAVMDNNHTKANSSLLKRLAERFGLPH
jgi:hypothetical protein